MDHDNEIADTTDAVCHPGDSSGDDGEQARSAAGTEPNDDAQLLAQYKHALLSGIPDHLPESILGSVRAEIAAVKQQTVHRPSFSILAKVAGLLLVFGLSLLLIMRHAVPDTDGSPNVSSLVKGVRPFAAEAETYPLVKEDVILYLQTQDGHTLLTAMDKPSKACLWQTPALSHVSSLTASNDKVFICYESGDDQRFVEARALRSGKMIWQHAEEATSVLHGPVSPMAVSGDLLCWTEKNEVCVLDSTTGELKLRERVSNCGRLSKPVTVNGQLFFASAQGLFTIGQSETPVIKELASYTGTVSRFNAPQIACDGESIVVASKFQGRHRVSCFDMESGKQMWQRVIRAPVYHIYFKDHVYIKSNQLYSIHRETGKVNWVRNIDGCSPLSFADNKLYTATAQETGDLLALDMMTGKTIWKKQIAASCSGLVISQRNGYLSGHDGILYAVDF